MKSKQVVYKLIERAYERMDSAEGTEGYDYCVAYNTRLLATIEERYPKWYLDYHLESEVK